jgi:hypothetical protein
MVTICVATAASDGMVTCSGNVPSAANAGAHGAHTIVAISASSKASATFTLT